MRLISAGSLVRAQSGPPPLFSVPDLSDYRLMRLFLQLCERILRLLRVLARWINFNDFFVPLWCAAILAKFRTNLAEIHHHQGVLRIDSVRLLKPVPGLRVITDH